MAQKYTQKHYAYMAHGTRGLIRDGLTDEEIIELQSNALRYYRMPIEERDLEKKSLRENETDYSY